MRYDEFLQEQRKLLPSLNVSRETFDRLDIYVKLLEEYNQKLNLVGSSEMSNIWDRHIFDSMQLLSYIPDSSHSICDFGSGAGFPGIVLGILGVSEMVLVESIGKKALFLENVSRETFIRNTVLCDRVENLKKTFDVITARAVAPLKDLLKLTKNIRTPGTVCVFPKGKKYQEEIDDARRYFSFEVEAHQSLTHEEGRILVISHVC
jgi:16S rRNA (guanine527-N7)-methyltransferase